MTPESREMEKMMIGGPGEYRTRNGWKASVVAVKDGWATGWIDCISRPQAWKTDGRYGCGPEVDLDLDLVGPWPSPQARKPVDGFVARRLSDGVLDFNNFFDVRAGVQNPAYEPVPVREVIPGSLVVLPDRAREAISEIDAMLYCFEKEGGGGTLPGRLQHIRALLTGMEPS